ncbi:MAG: hypothetical protein EBQ96_06240 [Proteobacteria bacterium]|nr:hypothetical protein [Pseudomonadota bacterium]
MQRVSPEALAVKFVSLARIEDGVLVAKRVQGGNVRIPVERVEDMVSIQPWDIAPPHFFMGKTVLRNNASPWFLYVNVEADVLKAVIGRDVPVHARTMNYADHVEAMYGKSVRILQGLDSRTRNTLYLCGFDTIEQVMEMSDYDMLTQVPDLGVQGLGTLRASVLMTPPDAPIPDELPPFCARVRGIKGFANVTGSTFPRGRGNLPPRPF